MTLKLLMAQVAEENFAEHTTWVKHKGAQRALQDIGYEVVEAPEDGTAAYYYVRDAFMRFGNVVIFPDVGELPCGIITRVQTKQGFNILKRFMCAAGDRVHTAAGIWFENGDFIADHEKQILFAGYHREGDAERNIKLARFLASIGLDEWTIIELPTKARAYDYIQKDPSSFYHLDFALAEKQQDGSVPYCPRAFMPVANERLRSIYKGKELLPVSYQDAIRGGLNMKANGRDIVTTHVSKVMRENFSARHLRLVDPKAYGVENFLIKNAGVHCITNDLSN